MSYLKHDPYHVEWADWEPESLARNPFSWYPLRRKPSWLARARRFVTDYATIAALIAVDLIATVYRWVRLDRDR